MGSGQKVLTISIAAYNAERYLDKCLRSFVESDVLEELEILVVDDGSTDMTAEIGRRYALQYPGSIRLIQKENGGHGSTINEGIRSATGRYFKIVDADDWVDREGINRLVAFLDGCDADLVLNHYRMVNEKGEITRDVSCVKRRDACAFSRVEGLEEVADNLTVQTHAFTFKHRILESMGRKIAEHCFYVDVEYAVFPLPHVETVAILDFPVYMYLCGRDGQSVSLLNMVRNRYQHLAVTKRIIDLYNEESARMKPKARGLLHGRILEVVETQYRIFVRMDDGRQSLRDIVSFERYLSDANREIYDGVAGRSGSKTAKFIKVMRKCRFKGYIYIRRGGVLIAQLLLRK